jgi:hypothetical protein
MYGTIGGVVLFALVVAFIYTFDPWLAFRVGGMGAIVIIQFALCAAIIFAIGPFVDLVYPRGVRHRDDRGTKARLRFPRELLLSFGRTKVQRKRLRTVYRKRIPIVPFVFAIILVMFPALANSAWYFHYKAEVPPSVFWPSFLVATVVAGRLGFGAAIQGMGHVSVALGRCPCCNYELTQLPPEDDGCTVCPECGAAWRLTMCPQCGHAFEDVLPDACPECEWRRAGGVGTDAPGVEPAVGDRR